MKWHAAALLVCVCACVHAQTIDPAPSEIECQIHPRRIWFNGVCYRADPDLDPCQARVPSPGSLLPGWLWCMAGPECAISNLTTLEGCKVREPLSSPTWWSDCRNREVAPLASTTGLLHVVAHCLEDVRCQWSDSEDACVPRWAVYCPENYAGNASGCAAESSCVWEDVLSDCRGVASDELSCDSVANGRALDLPNGRGEGACLPVPPYTAADRSYALTYLEGFDAGYRTLCHVDLNTGNQADCELLEHCVYSASAGCDLSPSVGGCRSHDWPSHYPPLQETCNAKTGCTYYDRPPEGVTALVREQSVCVQSPEVQTDDGTTTVTVTTHDVSHEGSITLSEKDAIAATAVTGVFVIVVCVVLSALSCNMEDESSARLVVREAMSEPQTRTTTTVVKHSARRKTHRHHSHGRR